MRPAIPRIILAAYSLVAAQPLHAQISPSPTTANSAAPASLTTDWLANPLGIDSPAPLFSWKLMDSRDGARQSAYRIQVATSADNLNSGKPDIWDSTRIPADASVGVRYSGRALKPTTRYFWRVLAWDQDSKPYPASATAWWETGLMGSTSAAAWDRSKWIGYEDREHKLIREADAAWITNQRVEKYDGLGADTRHDFRIGFAIGKPVKSATLYATGEDTVSAWINGAEVLAAQPLPPYAQMPWKKYVGGDATAALKPGSNVLSVEITLYAKPRSKDENLSPTPMNAALYVEFTDGTSQVIKTGAGNWKSALNAPEKWNAPSFDDTAWSAAIPYEGAKNDFGQIEQLGKPWATGPVKMLRHEFTVAKPLRSARVYVTALGVYELHINGARVGDQLLSPGWMDFREHVPYQTYDVTGQIRRGTNAIGALLAPGWYTTPLMWSGKVGITEPLPRLCARNCDSNTPTAQRSGLSRTNPGRPRSLLLSLRKFTTANPTTRGAFKLAGIAPGTQTQVGLTPIALRRVNHKSSRNTSNRFALNE